MCHIRGDMHIPSGGLLGQLACRAILSVDNLSVFVFVRGEVLGILVHGTQAHAHRRESTIVEEVLHGHLAGKVGEHHDTIVGTFLSIGIA